MASTADLEAEILAELEENPDAYVTPVNDVITIDPETRTIHLPASEALFGTEEEKDVERKFFKCPRIVGDNIDLAAHQIYISYMAVKDKNATLIPELLPETYWCEDVNVDDTGNYITFSWLLSGNVLRNRGFVGFAVIAKSMEGDVLKTRWKTAPAVGTVLMTIPDGGEEIADLYPDIISQIIAKIEKIESGSISDEVVATAVEKYMEVHPFEEAGTAESKVSEHNTSEASHNDIRLLVQGLTERLNALADSDDTTLDQMSEVVAYIKSNKSLIDAITTSKVNVSDIIDNLTTNVSNKPLSAAQGVALKALIDGITIPEKLPNPQKLTFDGAVTAEYDGSGEVTVTIPEGSGGSGGFGKAKSQILIDKEITELTASLSVTLEHDFHNLTAIINCGSDGAALTVGSDGTAVVSKIGILIDTTSFSYNSRKVASMDTSKETWKSIMLGAEWSDDLSVFKRGFGVTIGTGTSKNYYDLSFGGTSAMYGTLGTEDNAPRTGKTANIVVNGAYLNVGTRVILWGEYYE